MRIAWRVLVAGCLMLLAACDVGDSTTPEPSRTIAARVVMPTAALTFAPTATIPPTATLRPATPTASHAALPTATALPPSLTLVPTATTIAATATPAPVATFTLAAVGDLLLHYNIIDTAETRGYDYLFDPMRAYLSAADLTYANHEGPSDSATKLSGVFPTFNYSPKLDIAAKNAGIDIVSTANNHALDRGASGLDNTITSLTAAGLLWHGTSKRGTQRPPYQPFDLAPKNGVNVRGAFISATYGTNGAPDSYDQVNFLWNTGDTVRQTLLNQIAQAHTETDLVVVAAHWGVEYQFTPNAQQVAGAQELADAGADIIFGDHPHTIQPVDVLTAKDGRKVFIIYSLGNFIAAQSIYQAQSFTQTSVLLYVRVAKQGNDHARYIDYAYLPVYIENDTRPVPNVGNTYPLAKRHVLEQMRDSDGTRIFRLSP